LRRHPLDVRHHDRKKTRVPAWISYGESMTPIPCVLWDVSDGGARITAAHSNILPDAFVLILNRATNAHRFCQVVWRRQPHLGIKFVDPAEARVVPRPRLADPNRSGYGILAPRG
jgi:hypothetical protein